MENTEYLQRVHNIVKKLNWSIIDLYNILEKQFNTYETDATFPNIDTFRKQYSKTGKGSIKEFKKYYDYIYTLDEVKEKLSKKTSSKVEISISISIFIVAIILSFIIFLDYDPHNKYIIFLGQDKIFKDCQQKCFEIHPDYKLDDGNITPDDFKIIRRFNLDN